MILCRIRRDGRGRRQRGFDTKARSERRRTKRPGGQQQTELLAPRSARRGRLGVHGITSTPALDKCLRFRVPRADPSAGLRPARKQLQRDGLRASSFTSCLRVEFVDFVSSAARTRQYSGDWPIVGTHETTDRSVPSVRMRAHGTAAGALFHRRLSARGVRRPARTGDGRDWRRRRGDPRGSRDVGGGRLQAEQPVLLPDGRRGAARHPDHRRHIEAFDALPRTAAPRAVQRAGARTWRRGRAHHRDRIGRRARRIRGGRRADGAGRTRAVHTAPRRGARRGFWRRGDGACAGDQHRPLGRPALARDGVHAEAQGSGAEDPDQRPRSDRRRHALHQEPARDRTDATR